MNINTRHFTIVQTPQGKSVKRVCWIKKLYILCVEKKCKMKEFYENKDNLNRELGQFIGTLNLIMPKYLALLKKTKLSADEAQELGEIEHFLIEINAKITDIKNMLDHDLFGHSIDQYYQLKEKAKAGDIDARVKLDVLREALKESLKGDTLLNWN
jgi:hypothetical protein